MQSTEPSREKIITIAYELLGKRLSDEQIAGVDAAFGDVQDGFDLAASLAMSREALESLSPRALDLHLFMIHNARLKMARHLLPHADVILDLGGANSPLYRMGYPHAFKRLVLIDLPTEERHQEFQEVELENTGCDGEVIVRYEDMTELTGIADNSVDLVWSGQSIEHVSPELGLRMCAEAFRVLKPGGHFCLDTPNRLITKLHTAWCGGGYIHPDHKIEYTPDELRGILQRAGFRVHSEWGVCEMPLTSSSGEFSYQDFIVGGAISSAIDRSYIQFFHCTKDAPDAQKTAPSAAAASGAAATPASGIRGLMHRVWSGQR